MASAQLQQITSALSSTNIEESLTASQWASILEITPQAFRARGIAHSGMQLIQGGLTKVYAFATLPQDYQQAATAKRDRHAAGLYSELLDMVRVETSRWLPDFEFSTQPGATQEKALKVRLVMQAYFAALDAAKSKEEANRIARAEWTRHFGDACGERSIRRWEARIEERGGIEFAPIEAFCDRKAVPHVKARREHKLGIPADLIEAFKAATTTTEHISGAYRALVYDWDNGRPVPGLGIRQGNMPFPFKLAQLRPYAASTPARRSGIVPNFCRSRGLLVTARWSRIAMVFAPT